MMKEFCNTFCEAICDTFLNYHSTLKYHIRCYAPAKWMTYSFLSIPGSLERFAGELFSIPPLYHIFPSEILLRIITMMSYSCLFTCLNFPNTISSRRARHESTSFTILSQLFMWYSVWHIVGAQWSIYIDFKENKTQILAQDIHWLLFLPSCQRKCWFCPSGFQDLEEKVKSLI